MDPSSRALRAHIFPFFAFAVLAPLSGIRQFAGFSPPWWLQTPELWVYPLQTIVCGYLLWHYRASYEWSRPRHVIPAVAIGLAVFVLWVSPQLFFGQPPRTSGFDPTVVGGDSFLYWTVVAARFVRLVVVVPLFEEIFWRAFLLRYLVNERFQTLPLGAASRFSFVAVAVLFMLAHSPSDYPAAFVTGLIYNALMVWSRNIWTCVIAHATTNLLLGIYIIQTKQWGFW